MKYLRAFSIVFFILGTCAVLLVSLQYYRNNDTEGPIISMDSDTITVSVNAIEHEVLAGVTAYDSKDGDVTGSLLVENSSNFIGKGERLVNIVAFDSDNHVTSATRTIQYSDYKSPRFSLSAPLIFMQGNTRLESDLSATDLLDGDISRFIRVYNEENSNNLFNTYSKGTYKMVFSVANSAGDVSKFSASVIVQDSENSQNAPTIKLSDYLIYCKKGEDFNPYDFLQNIVFENVSYEKIAENIFVSKEEIRQLEQGNINLSQIKEFDLEQISIENNVDINKAGWYEVEYTLTDISDNTATVYLIVCVEE